MWDRILRTLFPPKCIFCKTLLKDHETDLCHHCRENAPEVSKGKIKLPFIAKWTALWYYEGKVRGSLLRFKFYGGRRYARAYGQMLAMKISRQFPEGFDLITWVPISPLRQLQRGYDQCELIAQVLCRELGCEPVRLLKKVRHTRPQSGLRDAASRRANVLNAYRVISPEQVAGKRILLLDDIITTGVTVSECAKVLQFSGAKEVYCAAVAVASHNRKQVK